MASTALLMALSPSKTPWVMLQPLATRNSRLAQVTSFSMVLEEQSTLADR